MPDIFLLPCPQRGSRSSFSVALILTTSRLIPTSCSTNQGTEEGDLFPEAGSGADCAPFGMPDVFLSCPQRGSRSCGVRAKIRHPTPESFSHTRTHSHSLSLTHTLFLSLTHTLSLSRSHTHTLTRTINPSTRTQALGRTARPIYMIHIYIYTYIYIYLYIYMYI